MHGYAKEYAKDVIYSVAKKFRVRGITRKRVVPHIALYGPGKTNDIRKVISAVEKVGRRYTLVSFKVKGFGYFDRTSKVIYFDINPSQELEDLRWILSQELKKISTGQSWDSQRNHSFHATIAFRDINAQFDRIWVYLKSKEEPNINQHLLRITVLGARGRIVCEYDLVLKKLLKRREALSKYWWRRTINRLRELQGLPPERQPSPLDWLRGIFNWPH
ncbi:MAG: 2'-5' RNA ligase family protein [Dehalococcoidia bacterium]|nr:2'-5' RNA ligase family protein [Dehalococcoidia bacterium]